MIGEAQRMAVTHPEFTDWWSRSKKPHATRTGASGRGGLWVAAREGQWPSWGTVLLEKLVEQEGRGGRGGVEGTGGDRRGCDLGEDGHFWQALVTWKLQ